MTPLAQARQYLARVLPWPVPGEGLAFIDIVWKFKSVKYDKPGWSGRAVTTLDDAIRALTFAMKSPDTLDIYVCQSSQREAQEITTAKGFKYMKPVRLQENAVALKSFFLDIDADKTALPGQEVKGYPTMGEAVAALGAFIRAVGLPKPSMMVASGGGLHVYWVLARALTPQEWYPLARALIEATKRHGLKLDEAVTTDAARILRVPDTFNLKTEPKRPVRIVGKPTDFDYSLERIASCLEPYKVDAVFLANTVAGSSLRFEVEPPPAAPRAPIKGVSDLAAGIETAMPQLEVRACLDAIPNAKVDWNFWNTIGMRVYAATEGADYGLAEWQRWSDTNPVAGATDTCSDRWSTLHTSPPTRTGAGALVNEVRAVTGNPTWQARATPQIAQGAVTQQVTGFGASAPQSVAPVPAAPVALAVSNDLPAGYTRTVTGLVMLIGVNEDGTPNMTPISDYPITDPILQRNPWILNFDTVTERGKQQRISISLESVGTTEMRKILQSQGFMLRIKASLAQEFFVAWIQQLQKTRDSIISAPFGWSDDPTKTGFVYGGKLFTPTGSSPAASADPALGRQYGPRGELQPWLDAAQMVTLQGRPSLDALIASAFGGPLVKFSGQRGLLLSTFSQESGIGKTTAMTVAQAVWGAPVRVQGLTDTQNAVFGKMGQLKNIPLYWDEIKTEEDFKGFVKLAFQLTKGAEKSRMRANTTLHESGEWQTLLAVASNDSLLDYVVQQTSTSPAGIMRVFEYEIAPGTQHQINRTDADRIIGKLNDSYGHPGLIYAKYLGENQAALYEEYGDFSRALGAEVKETNDERFWLILMSCLLLGAKYANHLGLTTIDEPALRAFLIGALDTMRRQRATQPNDLRQAMNVSNMLAQFLNAMKQRHTIWTNRVHITAGRPAPGAIKIMRPTDKLDGIYVHVGIEDKLVRISSTYLSQWLKDKGLSRYIFRDAMEREFGSKQVRGRIASGTIDAGATEYLIELQLAGHPLADFIDEA